MQFVIGQRTNLRDLCLFGLPGTVAAGDARLYGGCRVSFKVTSRGMLLRTVGEVVDTRPEDITNWVDDFVVIITKLPNSSPLSAKTLAAASAACFKFLNERKVKSDG